VGDKYLSLSGTSMATPHVVGAAALLAQQHPDWKGPRLKAALMASAKPNAELTAFDQGAGRVDVAKAITQSVLSEPVSLSFGTQLWPHDDDQPVTKTLTYRNVGTSPVTLSLTSSFTGPDGKAAPDGALTLSANEVTVPAGGTASVTATATTKHAGPDGLYSGSVTATAGTATVTTPLGVEKEVESYDLTITHTDRDGKVAADYSDLLYGVDNRLFDIFSGTDGTTKVRLPKGKYLVESFILTGTEENYTFSLLVRPTFVLDKTTTLSVDARDAKPISVGVERASVKPVLADVGYLFLTEDSSLDSSVLSESFDGIFTAHLGDSVDPEKFVARVNTQLAEPGADGTFENSPYRYSLAWFQTGRHITGFEKSVRDRQLAKVSATAHQTLPGRRSNKVTFGIGPSGAGGWAAVLNSDLPSVATEYYQPKGVQWYSEVGEHVLDEEGFPVNVSGLSSAPRSLKPGKRYQERWNAATFAPAFPAADFPYAARLGNDLFAGVPLFSDQDGHAGWSEADSAYTKLFRNGQLVGESEFGGYVEGLGLPAGRGDFTLETNVDRGQLFPFSTQVDATWKFRSGRVSGEEFKPLPLWSVQYQPEVDAENYAERDPLTLVPVTAQAQPGSDVGKLRKLRVEVSYDDGDTWHRAPLLPNGKHSWKAVLKPKEAKFVSFRATVVDSAGNSLEQTVIRAYGIR
jgi:hypothetical protein